MTSAVQEPAAATIDEAVASISFLAVALLSTTMPTFFPAAVAVVAVARYTGEQWRRWIRGPALIP